MDLVAPRHLDCVKHVCLPWRRRRRQHPDPSQFEVNNIWRSPALHPQHIRWKLRHCHIDACQPNRSAPAAQWPQADRAPAPMFSPCSNACRSSATIRAPARDRPPRTGHEADRPVPRTGRNIPPVGVALDGARNHTRNTTHARFLASVFRSRRSAWRAASMCIDPHAAGDHRRHPCPAPAPVYARLRPPARRW